MPKKPDHSFAIYLIAVFKLLKALLLVAVSIAALRLINADLGEKITDWARWAHVAPGNKHLQELLSQATEVSPKKIAVAAGVGFLYAAMFGTEGVGLMLGKRWAEYMTVITTAGLLPVEIYELFHKASAPKGIALAINAAAVAYLIVRLWKTREKKNSAQGGASNSPAIT